jgi:hypothetical protein
MAYFRLSRSYDHFIIGCINHLFHKRKTSDGIFLAAAIILIAVISSYQKAKSQRFRKLKDYKTLPKLLINL